LSRRKAARFLVRFVILGTAAGALAGYSAHAMRPGPARPADAAAGFAAAAPAPQTSNKTAKADRLPAPGKAAATSGDSVTYSLASLSPRTDFDRIGNEPIRTPEDSRVIGWVTSGGYGYSVRKSIAYGYLPSEHAAVGTRLDIELLGERIEAEVSREPLWDPKRERIRA